MLPRRQLKIGGFESVRHHKDPQATAGQQKNARIFVAGHRGLVGSAVVRRLRAEGFDNLLLRTRGELDLQDRTRSWRRSRSRRSTC